MKIHVWKAHSDGRTESPRRKSVPTLLWVTFENFPIAAMQEADLKQSIAGEQSGDQEENLNIEQSKYSLAGRRNALTPESHHIEPIRQAEMQEKLSCLSVKADSNNNNETDFKQEPGCSKSSD